MASATLVGALLLFPSGTGITTPAERGAMPPSMNAAPTSPSGATPAEVARAERLPSPRAVTLAFVILWAMLIGLVTLGFRRADQLGNELRRLERDLRKPTEPPGSASG